MDGWNGTWKIPTKDIHGLEQYYSANAMHHQADSWFIRKGETFVPISQGCQESHNHHTLLSSETNRDFRCLLGKNLRRKTWVSQVRPQRILFEIGILHILHQIRFWKSCIGICDLKDFTRAAQLFHQNLHQCAQHRHCINLHRYISEHCISTDFICRFAWNRNSYRNLVFAGCTRDKEQDWVRKDEKHRCEAWRGFPRSGSYCV